MDNKGPTFNLVMAWILFLTLGLPKFTDYGHVKQCSISPTYRRLRSLHLYSLFQFSYFLTRESPIAQVHVGVEHYARQQWWL